MHDPHAYEDDGDGFREDFHSRDDYMRFRSDWSYSWELPSPPLTYPARIKYSIEITEDGIETLGTFEYIPYE